MEEVKVLGENHNIYKVSDFIALGKTYKDAIGIVFGTPIIGLRVLAFDCCIQQWGKKDSILTESHNEPQAVQVLCGLDDTKRIVEAQKHLKELTAAKWCWEYEKGGFQWYLPSVMELAALFLIRDKVNDAMVRIGGGDYMLPAEYFDIFCVWSSCECSSAESWRVNFDNGKFCGRNKNGVGVVRAVGVLSQDTSSSLFSGDAKCTHPEMTDEELINQLRNRGYNGQITKTIQL